MTANSYYNQSGTPSTGSTGASAPVRSEFASIAVGFGLLPTLSGNGGRAVIINSLGTAQTVTTGQLALAGDFATTGAFNTTFAQSATTTLTLPAVSGTLATLAGTETLSNKTLVAPLLGTPANGVLTNCTGTAAGLTAGNVTTNANLTGPITSTGNATAVAAQTGTGTTFVMNTSPTLVTPALGVAMATSVAIGGATLGTNALAVTGHLLLEGVTSTGATGTGNLVFSSTPTLTTPVLGVSTATSIALGGATIGANALAVTGSVLFNTPLAVASGGTGAATITGVIKGNGTSAFTAATAGTDFVAPGTATTFTATQTFSGSASVFAMSVANISELATVSATAATGTINFDVSTQPVLFYTTSAVATWVVNVRFSSGTTLNSAMAVGSSVTVAFLVTQGATAYYNTSVQIDGTTSGVTTKWQGGTAPSAGNINGVDIYVYTIIKTGSAAYSVFASQTRYS